MTLLRPRSVPLVVLALTAGPLIWFFPDGFPSWRASAVLAGWAGYGLLLASLVLMLRDERISRWLGGVEYMTRWHHYVGITAYVLLLCHPTLLMIGGWQQSAAAGLAAIWPQPPGAVIVSGWVALLCMMAGLLATFLYKLPYPLWRVLHALLGVAVIVGSGHVLLLEANALVWLMLCVAVVAMAIRILRIDLGLAAQRYRVTHVTQAAPDIVEVTLQPVQPPLPPVAAGELVFVGFRWRTRWGGTGEFHPFTVSGIDHDGALRVGIKALGGDTQALQALPVGTAADVQGPHPGFLRHRPATAQLWVAGGIGITPFLAELRSSVLTQPTRLIYLAHSRTQAAYADELDALARQQPCLQFELVLTAGNNPDPLSLLPAATELAGQTCYLCGPPGMTDSFIRALRSRGVPNDRIHFERFDYR